jgi:phosphoenolpyruvate synthase/pyruvate phosphate dikinase
LGCADYDLLRRYWGEEPWGAYRDNIHAAIVAREVRRGSVKGTHAIKDFLLQTTERRAQDEQEAQRQSRGALFDMFRAMVTKGKGKDG